MPSSSNSCTIDRTDGALRAQVRPALPDEVQQCYRAVANECVTHGCKRVLIVGSSKIDAFSHLALRDALRAMALAGLPAGFRLAAVAQTANLIAIYDAAIVEAGRLGIEARRFLTEEDAARWLGA
ncbi:MAG TPA: hypothetical protein VE085_02060 [Burkholderiales bacterium]|nr:hypothetical protein [Burkholderiales bacterium]